MVVAMPKVRVGEPSCYEGLSLFPLFSRSESEVEYRLSDVALADESLQVVEVDEGGSVPELLVENKSDMRVLFLEGEELIGAKQNRILNTSVLVAAHSKIKIPVSCVEQGRWRYKSQNLTSSGSHSPARLRHALKASVTQSINLERGHRSDQSRVWEEVAYLNKSMTVDSQTGAMSDTFDANQESLASFKEKLPYVPGASGMAFAIGQKVVSVEMFDKPETCQHVWHRLLSGMVFEAITAKKSDQQATIAEVEQLLETTENLSWNQTEAIGEGDEFRAESTRGDHASALSFNETIVHSSMLIDVTG